MNNINFYIPMPPPNITGKLHAGHALFLTLQDIIIRFEKKYNDRKTKWIPGFDHAGIGGQNKILEAIRENNELGAAIEKSGFDIYAPYIANQTQDTIKRQIADLRAEPDWELERFTLDEKYQESTYAAFKQLYDRDLIYYSDLDGQWYLRLNQLAEEFAQRIEAGEITCYPESAQAKLLQTPDGKHITDAHDWCISRQIWWGQDIPALRRKQDGTWIMPPTKAEGDRLMELHPDEFTRSPDKLDTWFSSSLWAFAALGWPNWDDEAKSFYPAAILETGYDISFFWAAKMGMMGLALTGQIPYREIYFHGLIRDENGQKMSKTTGNGLDPGELIHQYGASVLRWTLAAHTTPGQDYSINHDDLESASRLIIKIKNAKRFLDQTDMSKYESMLKNSEAFMEQSWQDTDMKEFREEFLRAMNSRQIHLAAFLLRQFFWHTFCDKFIEEEKANRIEAKLMNPNQTEPMDIHFHTAFRNRIYFKELLKMFQLFMPDLLRE